MIKLTFNPRSDRIVKVFEAVPISIGKNPENKQVFCLPRDSLNDTHIIITRECGGFSVQNLANDPFVSLHGMPFGKKKLQNQDSIYIGKDQILFEMLDEAAQPSKQDAPDLSLAWNESVPQKKPLILNWRLFLWIFLIFTVMVSSIIGGLYLRATGKSSQEEKRIAAGIADIAMALRYARLHQINAQNRNFSNPEFLRSNISKVLSPKLDTLTEIDSQGRFIKHPYILRIYANNNLSRFLVIAQPAPNLFHWVMMKGAIVIDSKTMEIKLISDIKALNRLLTHPEPLDGANGEDISYLLSEGQTMSLPSLAGEKNNWGFTPPTALGFVRPSAENFIYNAPRYHPFGEYILNRAQELYSPQALSEEVARFRLEVKALSEFPELVLYSAEGMKSARKGQRALNALVPEHEFLIGSLKFSMTGMIAQQQLLMDENRKEIANSYDILPVMEVDELLINDFFSSQKTTIDQNNPLFIRLRELAANRKRALRPLYDKIISLLAVHTNQVQKDFQVNLKKYLTAYRKADRDQQTKISKELTKLLQKLPEMSAEQFLKFVEATELSEFAEKTVASFAQNLEKEVLTEEVFARKLAKVQRSRNLIVLNRQVNNLAKELKLDKLPDPQRLIDYQNRLHTAALQKISELILSPASAAKGRDRPYLEKIIRNTWPKDSDEGEFFLAEFDRSVEPNEH